MTKYPLTWPAGWKRTGPLMRRRAQFSHDHQRLTITRGVARVRYELERLNTDDDSIIISSNLRVRKDGSIIGEQKMPDDPGVAMSLRRSGYGRWDGVTEWLAAPLCDSARWTAR